MSCNYMLECEHIQALGPGTDPLLEELPNFVWCDRCRTWRSVIEVVGLEEDLDHEHERAS
ncbi:hypothetical protein [Amycolatopsis rhizosphaerae]|uniref:hypothetical protein n=1 Tax=Amycolatopsis rhizosphaerae TaxID=2053003 RepID=UPI001643F3BB|nr:hypothetical protein [Amycolatopsis rhizosphaerae]